jgi:hypothetical protein
MDIRHYYGRVVSVDTMARDSNGAVLPVIHVKADVDGSNLAIPWLPAASFQYQPVAGEVVEFSKLGNHDIRIVQFYGNNTDVIRKGEFGLNPGEVVVQSTTGKGFIKLGQSGEVGIVTGDTTTTLEGNDEGWEMSAPNVSIISFGNARFEILEDGSITAYRLDDDGNIKSKIEMDTEDNVSVECKGDFKVRASRILLDGKVSFGPGATTPEKEAKFGNVLTGGPYGKHPFDFLTGAAIPFEDNIKAGG